MKRQTNIFLFAAKVYSHTLNRNLKMRVLFFLIVCFCIVGITGTKVTSQDEEIIVEKKFGDIPVKLRSITAEKKFI